MRRHAVPVGEVTLSVLEGGVAGAPILLFLHGFPEHAAAWSGLMARFASTHRVVAPDQRGYNLSDKPDGVRAYSGGRLAGDIIALIDRLGGPVTLIGHDWGASVAYAVAMMAPAKLSSLIVLNGVHPGPFQQALLDDSAQIAASQYIHKLRREGVEDALLADDCARMFQMLTGFSDTGWLSAEMRAEYLAAWQQPGALTAMLNWYRASPLRVPLPGETPHGDNPFADTARFRIRPRHLLIWGEDDPALLPVSTRGLEGYCDDLTRVAIPGTDHWLAHQKPAEVEAAIRAFLPAGDAG